MCVVQVCVTVCQCQRSSLSEKRMRRTAAEEETMAAGKRSRREKERTAVRPSQVNNQQLLNTPEQAVNAPETTCKGKNEEM